jgi:protein-disulfide isomerase
MSGLVPSHLGQNDMITRKDFLGLGLASLVMLGPLAGSAKAQSVAQAELMQAGPLGDVFQGSPDAKVTMIEYASLTCGHCASFHQKTYPLLKQRYIDTGKVRYVLREFPLDPLATAGFMLARCEGDTKYYPIVDLLFSQQRQWAFSEKPVDALQGLVKQAGIGNEKFETCLRDDKLLNGINAVKNRGVEKLNVSSTPTFFINGQKLNGALNMEEIEKVVKPLLGE